MLTSEEKRKKLIDEILYSESKYFRETGRQANALFMGREDLTLLLTANDVLVGGKPIERNEHGIHFVLGMQVFVTEKAILGIGQVYR